jgi:hypothetical protein
VGGAEPPVVEHVHHEHEVGVGEVDGGEVRGAVVGEVDVVLGGRRHRVVGARPALALHEPRGVHVEVGVGVREPAGGVPLRQRAPADVPEAEEDHAGVRGEVAEGGVGRERPVAVCEREPEALAREREPPPRRTDVVAHRVTVSASAT